MEKVAVIVVAGGSGTRMGTELPKQFLPLASRPILMHTIAAFAQALPSAQVIVALPEAHFELWRDLCREHDFAVEHSLCEGGATRFESVKNALAEVSGADFVAVHDGVRPLISREVILSTLYLARNKGAAVPVVKPTSSLRELDPSGSHVVDREAFVEVQTPQIFAAELIQRAYLQPFCDGFTDDASVVEALGEKVALSQGSYSNIKVTSPVDLVVAEAIMAAAD